MKLIVRHTERYVLHVNGSPERWLGPGRHLIVRPFAQLELVRLQPDQLVADLSAETLAIAPPEEIRVISLGAFERALVSKRGRPVKWLGPGVHAIWTTDRVSATLPDGSRAMVPAVEIEVFDVSGVETAPLRDEVKALVPGSEYAEVTAAEGQVVLRHVDGKLDAVLPPGRHAVWKVQRKASLTAIDLREQILAVNGQEVMTKDRVTLRLNLAATYRVSDAAQLAAVAREPDAVLYLAVQLAAREAVASRTLDELLAAREALADGIAPAVRARAQAVGLEVLELGLKDVALPGEMKALLNRVIEAQKEAEANVILRREETAATRSLAQTAKVLAESPVLLRLKELEAYKELAGKVGQVHVVVGSEGVLSKLELKS